MRRRRRLDEQPNCGVGLLALDPQTVVRPRRRLRLASAATVSGALAIAWSLPGGRATDPVSGLPTHHHVAMAAQSLPRPVARPDRVSGAPTVAASPADAPAPEASAREPALIAEMAGVGVVEPSRAAILVGFHEASYPTALPLVPADPPSVDDGAGPIRTLERGQEHTAPLVILPSRDRGTHPASAVDVATPADAPVLAPVSGTVTRVAPYELYGRYPDTRVEIAPDGHPELQVTVLHVTGAAVGVGDPLVAGETPIAAGPTVFPFASQIDTFTAARVGRATPHVHVELRLR